MSTFSSHSAAATSDIRIKIHLHRRNGVEIRRIRGDYTFEQLQSVVQLWWNAPKVRWQYTDPIDKDDTIVLSSQPEWVECMAVHMEAHAPVVRLHLHKAKHSTTVVSTTTSKPKEEDSDVELESPVKPAVKTVAVEVAAEDVAVEEVPCPIEVLNAVMSCDGEVVDTPVELPNSVMELVTLIFGERLMCALWSGDLNSPILASNVARIRGRTSGTVWSPNKQVEVDFDLAALLKYANAVGCKLLDQNRYDDAKQIFALASSLPTDCKSTIQYNYACALALNGDIDAAMEALNDAVALGYNNVDHLERDEDLRSLWVLPEFHGLLIRMRNPLPDAPQTEEEEVIPAPPELVEVEETKVVTPVAQSYDDDFELVQDVVDQNDDVLGDDYEEFFENEGDVNPDDNDLVVEDVEEQENAAAERAAAALEAEVEAEPITPRSQKVDELSLIFPDLDKDILREILESHGFNIHKAVNVLLR